MTHGVKCLPHKPVSLSSLSLKSHIQAEDESQLTRLSSDLHINAVACKLTHSSNEYNFKGHWGDDWVSHLPCKHEGLSSIPEPTKQAQWHTLYWGRGDEGPWSQPASNLANQWAPRSGKRKRGVIQGDTQHQLLVSTQTRVQWVRHAHTHVCTHTHAQTQRSNKGIKRGK